MKQTWMLQMVLVGAIAGLTGCNANSSVPSSSIPTNSPSKIVNTSATPQVNTNGSTVESSMPAINILTEAHMGLLRHFKATSKEKSPAKSANVSKAQSGKSKTSPPKVTHVVAVPVAKQGSKSSQSVSRTNPVVVSSSPTPSQAPYHFGTPLPQNISFPPSTLSTGEEMNYVKQKGKQIFSGGASIWPLAFYTPNGEEYYVMVVFNQKLQTVFFLNETLFTSHQALATVVGNNDAKVIFTTTSFS